MSWREVKGKFKLLIRSLSIIEWIVIGFILIQLVFMVLKQVMKGA